MSLQSTAHSREERSASSGCEHVRSLAETATLSPRRLGVRDSHRILFLDARATGDLTA
jgi:hypothetical protein